MNELTMSFGSEALGVLVLALATDITACVSSCFRGALSERFLLCVIDGSRGEDLRLDTLPSSTVRGDRTEILCSLQYWKYLKNRLMVQILVTQLLSFGN